MARGAGTAIIVHHYPSWPKASYSLKELTAIARVAQVVALKQVASDVPHLTCHDEYLLSSLLSTGELLQLTERPDLPNGRSILRSTAAMQRGCVDNIGLSTSQGILALLQEVASAVSNAAGGASPS